MAHQDAKECIGHLDPSVSRRRFPMVDFGNSSPTSPTLTFEKSMRVHSGSQTVDVIYPGLAHCPGNAVVHVVEAGVLVAGDLLTKGCTPSFMGGSATNYLPVLEALAELNATVVVPGHGPVCGPEVIEETSRYVRMVLAVAGKALESGLTPLEAAKGADLGEFAYWHDHERLVGNLHRAMSELGERNPIDLQAMWRETEDYLGRPVRSMA